MKRQKIKAGVYYNPKSNRLGLITKEKDEFYLDLGEGICKILYPEYIGMGIVYIGTFEPPKKKVTQPKSESFHDFEGEGKGYIDDVPITKDDLVDVIEEDLEEEDDAFDVSTEEVERIVNQERE